MPKKTRGSGGEIPITEPEARLLRLFGGGGGGANRAASNRTASNRTASSWLIYGPQGAGKRRLARRIIQALVCVAPEDGLPCGRCAQCRRAKDGNLPDLHLMRPPKDKAGYAVEQVRDLLEELAQKPYEEGGHIVVFEEAQLLNAASQNALLKTLEEPPEGCVILLLATTREALLATVRSRCQSFRMRPWPEARLANWLEEELGVGEREARALAALSDGWPERARELSQKGSVQRDQALAFLERALTQGLASDWRLAEEMIGGQKSAEARKRVSGLLGQWESLMRDMLVLRAENESAASVSAAANPLPLLHGDQRDILEKLSNGFTDGAILDMMGDVARTRDDLRGNAQIQLSLEALLWDWEERKDDNGKRSRG